MENLYVLCLKKSKSNTFMFQYKASSYALTLRMQLFKEHLGLLDASASDTFDHRRKENRIVMDPLDDEFYFNVWNKIAEKNTLIYRELFKCVPDDTGKLYPVLIKICIESFFFLASSFCRATSSVYT